MGPVTGACAKELVGPQFLHTVLDATRLITDNRSTRPWSARSRHQRSRWAHSTCYEQSASASSFRPRQVELLQDASPIVKLPFYVQEARVRVLMGRE